LFQKRQDDQPVLLTAAAAENSGEKIDHLCRIDQREHPDLDSVLPNSKYNDKRKSSVDKFNKAFLPDI
jgi:hypothetical protein